MTKTAPDRNLALELVRVTESAALASARWVGRGDKNAADGAAVDAMRTLIPTVDMDGVIVIGEGEKDEAPMLFNGEHVGSGDGPKTDIAVDPVDGTTLTAAGKPNAIAVIAVSERGTMFDPKPSYYMEKIAVGPDAANAIDLRETPTWNLEQVAKAKRKKVSDLSVVVLERPRHDELIGEIRQTGARIKLISDGDVAGAIATARAGSGVDVLYGIGGTPEGVIAAAALKCLDGAMQSRLWAKDDEQKKVIEAAGKSLEQILMIDDLVAGNNCFFAATGITDGDLLRGVHYYPEYATTQSLIMRSMSGTIRQIEATHQLDKVNQYAAVKY